MIHLIDVDEENWIDIVRLKVKDEQQKYLDRPIGIIARGNIYIYIIIVMPVYLVLLTIPRLLELHWFEILRKSLLIMIYNSL